jgi:glycine/D-amino acid oxidase-like deaminating enzyme
MARTLLVLLSTIIFSVSLGHFTSAKAQATGTLSVTTTPVRGAIYVDTLFKGTHFWSGDLYVGSHMVSFGDVDGYIAPPPQTVTVIGDQTYYVIGAYRKLFSLLDRFLPAFRFVFIFPKEGLGHGSRNDSI